MKKHFRKLFLGVVIFSAFRAFAGLPPTSLKGQSGSSTTTFNYQVPFNQATQVSGPTSLIETGNGNVLANSGWEGGTGSWTASAGTYTTTSTASQIGSGAKAGSWDAAASADTLISTAVAIPAGFYGRNGVASCQVLCASGTCTHSIQAYDGTNILSTSAITSSTTVYERTSVNFVYPSSGNIQLRIYSNANEPVVYIDNCYLGLAEGHNIASVSQAQFIGSAYISTSGTCTPTRTSATLGALVDTDCAGATVDQNPGPGTIQTTDYDTIKFAVNSLPPGYYRATMQFGSYVLTSNQSCSFSISDGTDQKGTRSYGCSTTNTQGLTIEGYFNYTNTGNRTFELFGASVANALNIANELANGNAWFSLERFPTSSETIVRPDQTPASWSGYHSTDCTWTTTSTTFADLAADASCTFTERQNRNFGTVTSYLSGSDKLPGIVFTPNRAGRYFVCATATSANSAGTGASVRLVDSNSVEIATGGHNGGINWYMSTPMCGELNVASVGSALTIKYQVATPSGTLTLAPANTYQNAIEWTIFQLDAPMSAPILAGSILSNGTGPYRLEAASVAAACSSNPCTIAFQSGSWLSSITWNSTGNYTANIVAGMFTTAPACTITASELVILDSISTSAILFRTFNLAAALANAEFYINCMGTR